jgi:sugar transferase (PEP-CTERM/EpsH1 system associated)
MNILFIAREVPYPPISGVRMRVWHILKCLARHHTITLVCFGHEEDPVPAEAEAACARIIRVAPVKRPAGGALLLDMFRGLFSPLPYAVSCRYSEELRHTLEALIERDPVDLIMCDSLYLARHIPPAEARTVLNEHNIESVIIERYKNVEGHWLKKLYAAYELARMKRYEDRTWAKFDQCYVCSRVDKDIILKRVNHPHVAVIPNGVDTGAFTPQPQHQKPISLIYTGLISWKPNEDAVLYFLKEIYPLIKRQYPEVTFTVVGKGPCAEIRALADNDESVTVTGFVDAVMPYILESAVFIVPLRIGSGTRLKILEAWAMGKAVVSTSIGCEGLDCRDGQEIMIADTPREFADKVAGLLGNPELKQALERNGRTLAEETYSWDVIARTIKQEMEHIGS